MVNRLLRDDPSKGDMNNREGVGLRLLVTVLGEWEMWPLYMIGLTSYIAPEPMKTYISKMLVDMGFSTFDANMLAVPSQFLFAVNTISMVKSDALFSYIAPSNVIGWMLSPLRYFVPFRRFVRFNRTVIKISHFPVLFIIFGYEVFFAISLLQTPDDRGPLDGLMGLLIGVYGLGIVRAWQLLGARRFKVFGGLLSLFQGPEASPTMDKEEHKLSAKPGGAQPGSGETPSA